MEEVDDLIFSSFFAFVGGVSSWFFGRLDGTIYALITFCVMDYITGVLAAGIKHELSSSIGFNGIARKITIFVLVGIANIIDRELLDHTAWLRDAVLFFYLANEGISILENAVVIGIPVPEILKEKLLQFRDYKRKKKNKKEMLSQHSE